MKQGMNLVDMARELERQAEVKRDFIADSRKMLVSQDAGTLALLDAENRPVQELEVMPQAHAQLASKFKIYKPHYDRLLNDHPDLLAHTLNALFEREPKQAMVRTLDNRARAVMSDSYRPLDNYDLFDAIFPVLTEAGATVESCAITETKMYIKVLCPWLDREIPMPEGWTMGQGHNIWVRKVIGAVTIGNSEVGAGSLFVNPGVFERQCTNLATFRSDGYRKIHVGKKKGADNEVSEYLSDQTKRLDDAAVWSRIRDIVKATMDGRVMDNIVKKMADARGDKIEGNPAAVIEVFAKKNQLTEKESGGLLRHLTESGEMTRYGLQWAATRLAQDVDDYDRASELERLGGQIIELPKRDWNVIANAA